MAMKYRNRDVGPNFTHETTDPRMHGRHIPLFRKLRRIPVDEKENTRQYFTEGHTPYHDYSLVSSRTSSAAVSGYSSRNVSRRNSFLSAGALEEGRYKRKKAAPPPPAHLHPGQYSSLPTFSPDSSGSEKARRDKQKQKRRAPPPPNTAHQPRAAPQHQHRSQPPAAHSAGPVHSAGPAHSAGPGRPVIPAPVAPSPVVPPHAIPPPVVPPPASPSRSLAPPLRDRTWSMETLYSVTSHVVKADVHQEAPPTEPPVDYDVDDPPRKSGSSKTSDPASHAPIAPPPGFEDKEVHTPREEGSSPTVPVATPVPPPPPPPPPIHLHLHTPTLTNRTEGSSTPKKIPPKANTDSSVAPNPGLPSHLKAQIIAAAKKRSANGPVELPDPPKAFHQLFEEELKSAFARRQQRRQKGTIRLKLDRGQSVTHRASEDSTSSTTPPATPQAKPSPQPKKDASDILLGALKTATKRPPAPAAWTPEHDLGDDIFDSDTESTQVLSGNRQDYYEMIHGPANNTHFKKHTAAVSQSSRHSSISKLKRSMKHAIGSVSKKSTSRKPINKTEWQIYPACSYDDVPEGPMNIKRVERGPAYAYNPTKGQLVLLPDYDQVIVTDDDRRIREEDLSKGRSSKKLQQLIKEKSKENNGRVVIPTPLRDHDPKIAEERMEQDIMEMQFQQVQLLNRQYREEGLPVGQEPKSPAWQVLNNPDLLAPPTSLINDNTSTWGSLRSGLDTWKSSKVTLNASRKTLEHREPIVVLNEGNSNSKKKNKKSLKLKIDEWTSSQPAAKQKVLQKGWKAFQQIQRRDSPDVNLSNPVYSSDDDEDFPGKDTTSSETGAKKVIPKPKTLDDSGYRSEAPREISQSSPTRGSAPHASAPLASPALESPQSHAQTIMFSNLVSQGHPPHQNGYSQTAPVYNNSTTAYSPPVNYAPSMNGNTAGLHQYNLTTTAGFVPGMTSPQSQLNSRPVSAPIAANITMAPLNSYPSANDPARSPFQNPLPVILDGRQPIVPQASQLENGSTSLSYGSHPQTNGSIPQVNGLAPQMNGSMLQMHGSTSQMNGSTPKMNGSMSQMNGPMNQMNGSMFQMNGSLPQMNGSIPQTNGSIPQTNGFIPQSNGSTVVQDREVSDFNRRKELVVGPVGYRPVKFDPNAYQTPVSLPKSPNSGTISPPWIQPGEELVAL